MKLAIFLLLASSVASCQLTTRNTAGETPSSPAVTHANGVTPDPALHEMLIQVQAATQKSDADLARLRVDKWKTDSTSRQQAEATVASIRRNLTNAVPDLLQRIQAAPSSLIANFRLYRNFNALYDTFSSLVESAGAFGPKEQYTPLSEDIALIDQLRHQLAERMDMLAGANDAELVRLRSLVQSANRPATTTKVVVSDDEPKPKKKSKPAPRPAQPSQ